MIAQLRGRVRVKAPNQVIVEVGGIGFQVFIPLSTFYHLPAPEEEVLLLTRVFMKEEGLFLYGFLSEEERGLFDLLCGISGIGPRLATNILSGISPDELITALSTEDRLRLQAIPGVGRKLAARMALELKEKVGSIPGPSSVQAEPKEAEGDLLADLVSALENLGYQRHKASRAARAAIQSAGGALGLEGLIREALRRLSA